MDRYAAIRRCIQADLDRYGRLYEEALAGGVPLAAEVAGHVLARRGKQLRPVLVLLAARAAGGGAASTATLLAAVALELVHDASLIHDDVIDRSDERRGARTVAGVWDNRVAVLAGDFLLSRSLLAVGRAGRAELYGVLARVVSRLTEGELAQLSATRTCGGGCARAPLHENMGTMRTGAVAEPEGVEGEAGYLDVIAGKTASLFGACMEAGALTAGAGAEVLRTLRQAGELMGLAFQIRDDVFDYFPSTAALGKPTGHDIAEGKVTLPLLYALHHAKGGEAARARALVEGGGPLSEGDVACLVELAKTSGGIAYARARMEAYAETARRELRSLPEGEARSALVELVGYLIDRDC